MALLFGALFIVGLAVRPAGAFQTPRDVVVLVLAVALAVAARRTSVRSIVVLSGRAVAVPILALIGALVRVSAPCVLMGAASLWCSAG